jgi:hypothetical protein
MACPLAGRSERSYRPVSMATSLDGCVTFVLAVVLGAPILRYLAIFDPVFHDAPFLRLITNCLVGEGKKSLQKEG